MLPIVNRYNQEFQTKNPKIHLLYSKMETLYLRIWSLYKDDKLLYAGSSSSIDHQNEENVCVLSETDLGPTANISLEHFQKKQLQLKVL